MEMGKKNHKLLRMHRKQSVENNFIMKAFKRQKKQEAGISDSSREVSVDEDSYQNEIQKFSRHDHLESNLTLVKKEKWDWIISYYS